MPRRIAVGLALIGLLLACFARLAADPSALVVDADRPSIDEARPVEDRSVGNDLTRLFLPHHLAIARSIARLGRLPLWDDRGFGGRPLVGNPQAGLFYPPAWIAWRVGTPSALGWITVGHLLWSGLGAYRLARTLGMGTWGRLVAAGCVQCSPYVLAQTFEGHYPHVWAASWYPWAFDAAIRLRRGERSAVPALAAILAATFLAGHPQEGYYLAIALAAWVAYDGLAATRSGRVREAARLWAAWGLASALVAGLVAVKLVPDAMAQGWGLRWSRLSIRQAGRYHLDPINLLQSVGSRALGGPSDYFGHESYWETVATIGLVPLTLATIGATWSRDRRSARGWLILAAGAVVFASGRKLGLFAALFTLVPGMERFRVPARSLFLASLAASMLAGLGVEALRAWSVEDVRWRRLGRRAIVFAVLLALVVLAGHWAWKRRDVAALVLPRTMGTAYPGTRPGRVPEGDRWLRGLSRLAVDPVFWLALGGSTLGIAWGARRPGDRRAVAAGLGLLGLVELGLYGHDLLRTTPAARFLGADPIGQALARARPPGLVPPRIRVVDALYGDLRAGQEGFSKTNVNDSFQIQHAADLYETLYHVFRPEADDRGAPMDSAVARFRREVRQSVLDRMGVGLLVSDREVAGSPWSPVGSGTSDGSHFVVLRNPTALPRAYVVPRAEVAPDDRDTVARFREVDPRRAVLMPSDPIGGPPRARQPFTPAEWTSDDPDRLVLRVTTEAPGLLVVADTWMPGWSAEVDGRAAPVLKGNRAQRVVPLPEPGRHRIVLTYRTPGLTAGLAITAASLAIWAGLIAAPWLARIRLRRLSLISPSATG